jgi:hypothetical protein
MASRTCAVFLLAVACSSQPPPVSTSLSTIDTFERTGDRSVVKPNAALPFMSGANNPGPFPALGPGTGTQSASGTGLSILPAFSEAQPAACIQTEVWQEFERIWLQPMYIALSPTGAPVGLPIFAVGQDTRFYSPYWQVFFFTPPAGAHFTSEREVIESGAKLLPGSGVYYALTSDPTVKSAVQDGDVPRRPLSGEPVGAAANEEGYVDGAIVHYVDLGNEQRYTWNYETLVVDETPMYSFAIEHDKAIVPVDIPRVAGTGPLHAPLCDGHGVCSGVVSGVPQFGGLWRLNTVLLPPGADVYVPASEPKLRSAMQQAGFAATVPEKDLGPAFTLRVALDGTCLATNIDGCQWLDSQKAIESLVPDFRVTQSETRIACPLVLFNGKPIGQ